MTDEPDRDQAREEGAERRVYHPDDDDATLPETVLEAVEAYEDVDVIRSEFVLFDAVDPDALDDLFRAEADANVVVGFSVDDVRVRLLDDGGVDVRVTDSDGNRS